jgi:hypothetical protein
MKHINRINILLVFLSSLCFFYLFLDYNQVSFIDTMARFVVLCGGIGCLLVSCYFSWVAVNVLRDQVEYDIETYGSPCWTDDDDWNPKQHADDFELWFEEELVPTDAEQVPDFRKPYPSYPVSTFDLRSFVSDDDDDGDDWFST